MMEKLAVLSLNMAERGKCAIKPIYCSEEIQKVFLLALHMVLRNSTGNYRELKDK